MADRPDEKVRVTSGNAPAPNEVTREHPGRYDLRSDLAQGGQSKVHVAYDRHLGREVAFKQPVLPSSSSSALPPMPSSPGVSSAVQRFLREARITAQLEHPNIVAVYEIGSREDGTLYCTQKLVRPDTAGSAPRTFAAALRDAATLRDRLALLPHFTNLCNALAYAHSKGVIHRDVKPDNIVLGSFGETVLLDWGLAKVTGESDVWPDPLPASPNMSMVGVALGTPGYMSPEQAAGLGDSVDERSDVWSLGVILYQVLAGRRPTGVPHDDPAPLADIAPSAPPELVAIVMKAMARDPVARYRDAKALAADILAWQTGDRVAVYDYTALDAVRLFVARHRLASMVAGVAAVLLAISGALLWTSWRESRSNLAKARGYLARALVDKARAAESAYEWDRAAVWFAAARVQEDRGDARMGSTLAATRAMPDMLRLDTGKGALLAIAFAPDGSIAAGGTGRSVHLWGPARDERGVLPHQSAVSGIAWSPDGTAAVTVGHDGRALAWDLARSAEPRLLLQNIDDLTSVAFAPDGDMLVFGTEDELVVLMEFRTGKVLATLKAEGLRMGPVYSVGFSRDGKTVLAGCWDNTLRAWDVKTHARRFTLDTSPGAERGSASVFTLAISPDGETVATGSRDRSVRVWNLADGTATLRLDGHTNKVYAVAFSPDGNLLASGGTDRTIRIWDTHGGQQLVGSSFGFEEDDVSALAFSPDGKSIAWGGSGGKVWLRAIPPAKPPTPPERIYALSFSSDGRLLLHAENGWLILRDAATFAERHRYGGDFGALQMDAVFSPDGRALAIVCHTNDACVIDAATGREILRVRVDSKHLQTVSWSPDGAMIAAAGVEGVVRLFSAADGSLLGELKGHKDAIFDSAFSPDGSLLATASYDKTVRLWDAKTHEPVATLEGHADGVRRVQFSPDGLQLASASWDKTVRLWDIATRTQRLAIGGHDDYVFGVDFSPDGKWLATASWDGTLRLWNTGDGAELARFVSDERRIFSVAVAPDGKSVAYAGLRVHLVPLQPLGTPEDDLKKVLRLTGLKLDGLGLVRTH